MTMLNDIQNNKQNLENTQAIIPATKRLIAVR